MTSKSVSISCGSGSSHCGKILNVHFGMKIIVTRRLNPNDVINDQLTFSVSIIVAHCLHASRFFTAFTASLGLQIQQPWHSIHQFINDSRQRRQSLTHKHLLKNLVQQSIATGKD